MLAVFILLLSQAPPAAPVKPKAAVRVLRAEPVTEREWKRSKEQVERVIVEKDGSKVLVRLIEHQ